MSDPKRPMIQRYDEPRTAGDLAHAIEVFAMDQWGLGASGGTSGAGGDLEFALEDEDAIVLVLSADQGRAIKYLGANKVLDDGMRLEWLAPDELALLETYRAGGLAALRSPAESSN